MRGRSIARGMALLLVVMASTADRTAIAAAPVARPKAAIDAFVRVDQVGYEASAHKRAYLMARSPMPGAGFEVVMGGSTVVLTGSAGKDLGSWGKRFPHVYALPFDVVTAPGTYRVVVDLPSPVASPPFQIGDPVDLFEPILANALSFYRAQRDGPNVIASVLDRQPSHLHDANAKTFLRAHYRPDYTIRDPVPVPGAPRRDVSGGWFDAGDYIKGIHTQSYAASLLLVARRDFPALVGPGSGADLTAELRFELRWLLRMWDDQTRTLYYQVGFGDGSRSLAGDHDIWRLPEVDDTYGGSKPRYRYIRHRPAFRAGPPGSLVSPNLAGRLAAAFALCFQVYRGSDPNLADDCVTAGQHIFDLADPHPGRLLTFSPFAYYPETEWRSDMELGAVELYRAAAMGGLPTGLPHTEPRYFLRRAAKWADGYIHGDELGDTLNLYDVSALAHGELVRAMDASGGGGLAVTRGQVIGDIRRQLEQAAREAAPDPFGFGFPYAEYDGTSHAQGLAITAALYTELTGDHRWDAFGRRQLDVILGANAWGTSFIVGAGDTFPHCVHHQVANLVGALDGTAPVLLGAAVNGTNAKNQFKYLGLPEGGQRCPPDGSDPFARFNARGARWWDDARSWPTSEPAIDFAATTPLAFAMQTT